MYEQDYIMRLIHEMVRVLLKLVFHINAEKISSELLEKTEQRVTLEKLLNQVDEGNIEDAENQIYELMEERNLEHLEIALLFYSYLNDKSDEFLEEHHFSRLEVKHGLEEMISRYGLEGISQLFLQ